jgi:hypothetical protein
VGTASLCPRVKQLGHGIAHPPPFSAAVKRKVELYIYSSGVPSWSVFRVIFTFVFYILWGYELIYVANNVTGFSVRY